jgi:glyoxylase-like metal-dependent hydrolase (beta-lactamase superfamily II)
MTEPIVIDTKMHGRDQITAAYVVRGEKTALVETGPKSCLDHVLAGLASAGVEDLDWIVVTHIHLDHAGAAGTLAARFPNARVAVHEVGAPHLIDPSRLWASAARIYGDEMDRMWGGIDAIPENRIRTLADGDKLDLGGRVLEAIDTPGHAYHHHVFLDDATGIAFTGDALGVRLPDVGVIRPATPPPEFNLEAAIASIQRIAELQPQALWPTHFGSAQDGVDATDVETTCEWAIEALHLWASWVTAARSRSDDLDDVAAEVAAQARAHYEGRISPDATDRLEQTTSYRMNTWGYSRYFDKAQRSD